MISSIRPFSDSPSSTQLSFTSLKMRFKQAWDRCDFEKLEDCLDEGLSLCDPENSPLSSSAEWVDLYLCSPFRLLTKLLKKGAHLHHVDPEGNNALHLVANSITSDSNACLRLLLETGMDPNSKNRAEETPLICCVKGWGALKEQTTYYKLKEKVQILLERGADVWHRDQKGYTALDHALSIEDKQVIRLLLEHNAPANREKNHPLISSLRKAIAQDVCIRTIRSRTFHSKRLVLSQRHSD